ncbi:MAG: hypothetical protein Q7T16_00740 [Candidatus Burarchaeum sp.]|nr:hypothetical protein [Candidatus Burarchaeum sp.]MDO8339163.1 hypothetical protein [Candidatus Burarchaeum sp.]
MKLSFVLFGLLFGLLLFSASASASFQQVYHKFDMTLNDDGTARVLEEYEFYMDSNESSNFYDQVMSLQDISAWKNVTALESLRIHMDSKFVKLENFRIRAERRQGCNPWTGTCYGIVRVEYTASNVEPGSFVRIEQSKPRTYNYTLNPRALSFETSETGDVALPAGTDVKIKIPADACITRLNPFPEYFTNTALPLCGVSELSWSGPSVLARFDLSFVREDALETEVIQFFRNAQRGLVDFINSTQGLVVLVMAGVALCSLVLLRHYQDTQKESK